MNKGFKHIVRCFLAIILMIVIVLPSFGQKVGTTSYQFLKVMPSAQATGMGEAYASHAWGVNSVFWNPAGIVGIENQEFSVSHIDWIFDTNQNAVAYGLNMGNWGFMGLQLQYIDYGEIEETRVDHLEFIGGEYNPGLTGRTFTPSAWVVGLTYANQLVERFSTGITVKYVHESLWGNSQITSPNDQNYDAESQTVLFDMGMQYFTGYRSVKLGAVVQNFGPSVNYAETSYPAPMVFRLGINGFLIGKTESLLLTDNWHQVLLAFDLVHPNDYDQQMHAGMEYIFADLLSLRAGHKFNYDSEKWTFGAGVKTSMKQLGLSIDYSYGSLGEFLGHSHRFTISANIN